VWSGANRSINALLTFQIFWEIFWTDTTHRPMLASRLTAPFSAPPRLQGSLKPAAEKTRCMAFPESPRGGPANHSYFARRRPQNAIRVRLIRSGRQAPGRRSQSAISDPGRDAFKPADRLYRPSPSYRPTDPQDLMRSDPLRPRSGTRSVRPRKRTMTSACAMAMLPWPPWSA